MDKGQEITTTIVTRFFSDIIGNLNELSSSDFGNISSGQILSKGKAWTPHMSELANPDGQGALSESLDISSEQYFDNMECPSIWGEDGKVKKRSINYLQKLLNDVSMITEM